MTSAKRRPRFGKTKMKREDEDGATFSIYASPRPMPGRGIGWDPERGRYVILEDGSTERCTIDLAIGLFVSAASCGSIELRRQICEIACECFLAAQMNMMDGKVGRPKGSKNKNDRDREVVERGRARIMTGAARGHYAAAAAVISDRAGAFTAEQIENAKRRIGRKIKQAAGP